MQRLAVAAAIAGAVQASPAHALGGGVTLSQSVGVTTVQVNQAFTISKAGNLSSVTYGPFDLTFTLTSNSVPVPSWGTVGGISAYEYSGPNNIYTTLTSTNILSGTFEPASTNNPSTLTVYSDGRINFVISSSTNTPPNDCFTEKLITGATGPNCQPYLKTLDLTVYTGKPGVPTTDPGSVNYPTISNLLVDYIGTGYYSTGIISSGQEASLKFTSKVPSPLPILGASMAFGFSR